MALATQHGKGDAVARPLEVHLGASVHVAAVDTDQLGTFTGERERPGPAATVCEQKARLGMAALALPYGLASEGSFGPHPAAPFASGGVELLTFVDDVRGLVVTEQSLTFDTNFSHRVVTRAAELDEWLGAARFPSHALIVRAAEAPSSTPIVKGIRDRGELTAAVDAAVRASPVGRAQVETDMRAHCNPTRMAHIAQLAEQLARRLATPCPECGAPAWGVTSVERGLPCAWCDTPTERARGEWMGSPACAHRAFRPRTDGRSHADPGECLRCNP